MLQRNAEAIQPDRDCADQRAGEKALEDIQDAASDIRMPVLIPNGDVEDRDHNSRGKKRPAEKREQADKGLYPGQVKDFSAHVSDHDEEVRHGVIDNAVDPFQEGIEDGCGDGVSDPAEDAADGVADPLHQVYQPVKYIPHLL